MKKFLIILIFASCNHDNNTDKKKSDLTNPTDSLISRIVGKWGGENSHPVWEITKDSMYYFNEKKSYYYLIHKKDMIVLYKEGPFMLGDIHVLKDTLFFETDAGITKAFRVR